MSRSVFRGDGPRAARLAALAAVSLLALAALAGCGGVHKGDPALPPGFLEAGLPDVELNAYVHVATARELAVPSGIFGEAGGGPEPGVILALSAFMKDTIGEFGASIDFAGVEDAALARELVEAADAGAPWLDQRGSTLRLVAGDSPWARELRSAWESGSRVDLRREYSGAWNLMRMLPETAPAPPVAAGFLRNVPDMAEKLLERQGVGASGLDSALSLVRAREMAFAVYATDLEEVPRDGLDEALGRAGVGVIAVTRAGYPGFIVNFLTGRFMDRAGLEKVRVGEESARYRRLDDRVHLMLKNYGSTFFFTLAPTREGAQELMQSVVENQS